MRWLTVIGLVLAATAARSEDIVEVLQRSQQMRLDAMRLADIGSARARTVQASFNTLKRSIAPDRDIELRVIEGDTTAETLLGHVVVANSALAELPEAERQFILAHELGHVLMNHQAQMGLVYQKWVPGAVTQQHTDAVAGRLGRDASGLAYQHEFSADAFAMRSMCALGHSRDEVMAMFMHLGVYRDTATHPGTAKRMAALRAAPAETANEGSLAMAH